MIPEIKKKKPSFNILLIPSFKARYFQIIGALVVHNFQTKHGSNMYNTFKPIHSNPSLQVVSDTQFPCFCIIPA